ncbi:MAG: hypothetical protein ACFCUX_07850 [Candidatus Methylacidiphilales bacterium]
MDLGDLIIPIIIIGSVIVQWLGSRKEASPSTPQPPRVPRPQTPSPEYERRELDPSLDDLMEALGAPPARPTPPRMPMDTQRPRIPAPVHTPRVVIPAAPSPFERERKRLEEKQKELEALTAKLASRPATAPARVRAVRDKATGLRSILKNKPAMRDAMVLNEILQPPVSLRVHTT